MLPPYELFKAERPGLREEAPQYAMIYPLIETDPYLFFTMQHQTRDSVLIFDKQTGTTTPLARESGRKGFMNDWDGGLPFWPDRANEAQELVMAVWPYELQEWLAENDPDDRAVADPAARERLKALAASLDPEGNPIVVIGTLKRR